MSLPLPFFILAMTLSSPDSAFAQEPPGSIEKKTADGVPLWLVPEMEEIQELDKWGEYSGSKTWQTEKAVSSFRPLWEKRCCEIAKSIDAARVRSLSLWAEKEMKAYRKVPRLEAITFKPVKLNDSKTVIVMEGTAGVLPSHHKLVTRWLKIFLLFNTDTLEFEKIYVTIRGQLLE